MQMNLDIPLLPADGVGPELAEVAHCCIDAVNRATGSRVRLTEYPVGYAAYRETGSPLPAQTIEAMRRSAATLLGPMHNKECPPPSPTGQMRRLLDLFVDVRHCVSVAGSLRQNVDLVVFRECSEGFLSDRNMFEGPGEFMPTPDTALSIRVVTRKKCEQIARLAFEYARKHGRKKITVAHKKVVFPLGCGLFLDCVMREASNFPEVAVDDEWVDDLAGHVVAQPENYDMILATNMFGDILGDVAAAQVGGMVPIINASSHTAVFCPSHVPHMEISGKQKANPVGMIRTIAAMLHWLGLDVAGRVMDEALGATAVATAGLSASLPGDMTTKQVTQSVVQAIRVADGPKREQAVR